MYKGISATIVIDPSNRAEESIGKKFGAER